jgi:hypothetical protein
MRTYEGFLLGVIAGVAAVWCWRRELEVGARDKTRRVRARAAEGLQAVAEGTEKALDRGGDALRRAEESLQDTREQVGEALRTGEDAMCPTTSPRGA